MEDYDKIVRTWYLDLREPFTKFIASKFKGFDDSVIEDIYQDTFSAIAQNLRDGRVQPDTNWRAYIFRIGYNLALNHARNAPDTVQLVEQYDDEAKGEARQVADTQCIDRVAEENTISDEDKERMIDTMNSYITNMTDPCRTVLLEFYYGHRSLEDIRVMIGHKTVDSVKTQRLKCFRKLQTALLAQFQLMGLSIF